MDLATDILFMDQAMYKCRTACMCNSVAKRPTLRKRITLCLLTKQHLCVELTVMPRQDRDPQRCRCCAADWFNWRRSSITRCRTHHPPVAACAAKKAMLSSHPPPQHSQFTNWLCNNGMLVEVRLHPMLFGKVITSCAYSAVSMILRQTVSDFMHYMLSPEAFGSACMVHLTVEAAAQHCLPPGVVLVKDVSPVMPYGTVWQSNDVTTAPLDCHKESDSDPQSWPAAGNGPGCSVVSAWTRCRGSYDPGSKAPVCGRHHRRTHRWPCAGRSSAAEDVWAPQSLSSSCRLSGRSRQQVHSISAFRS